MAARVLVVAWIKHPEALLAHRKSMFLMWLILGSLLSSKASTRFPDMSSRSTALSLSSTAGMWGNVLKESPRLQSCARSPNSSGRELKWFPSRERVCRLEEENKKYIQNAERSVWDCDKEFAILHKSYTSLNSVNSADIWNFTRSGNLLWCL